MSHKKGRSEESQDVNNAVWCWSCVEREALIRVLSPVIQEEAQQITLKLDVARFTASSG